MLRKISFIGLILCSVCWIAWNFISNEFQHKIEDPSYFLSERDTTLTRVNFSETEYASLLSIENNDNILLKQIRTEENIQSVYFTNDSSKLLIEGNQHWNIELIEKVLEVEIKSTSFNNKTFSFSGFNGLVQNDFLILYLGEQLNSDNKYIKLNLDLKADINKLRIANNHLISKEDIYLTPYKSYLTEYSKTLLPNRIDDYLIFGSVTSSRVEKYDFYEKNFLAEKDSVYQKSPMFSWTQNGVIFLLYKGETILITDFNQGLDPILMLNEANQSYDQTQFDINLVNSSLFPYKKYHIDYIDDHIIIASDKSIIDAYKSEIKLGTSLTNTNHSLNESFNELPKLSSHRQIDKSIIYSTSQYESMQITSSLLNDIHLSEPQSEEITLINPDINIQDFKVSKSKKYILVKGNDSVVKIFKDNSEISKIIAESKIQDYDVIDLNNNGNEILVIQCKNKIKLYDLNGNLKTTIKISEEKIIYSGIKYYTWRGQGYFVFTDSKYMMHIFDNQGRNHKMFQVSESDHQSVSVWSSQNKLFYGINTQTEFIMISASEEKEYRRFNRNSTFSPAKSQNELFHFALVDNALVKVDQRGNQVVINQGENFKIFPTAYLNNQAIIPIQKGSEILFYNTEGIPFGQIKLSFNEVEDVHISKGLNEKISVSFFDAIENKVYLYTTDGQSLINKKLEGEQKALHYWSKESLNIITIIGNSIIIYNYKQ